MRTFNYSAIKEQKWDSDVLGLIAAIYKEAGKQELYLKQRPEELEKLVEIAKIQSTEASNAIEGIVTTSTRIRQLVEEKTTPRNRDEQEIAGYRDVLSIIHESFDAIPITQNYILQLHKILYEEITEESYRCPQCGWTMMQGKYGYSCHSTHCTDTLPEFTDEMKLDISAGDLYRLKKGIMRYFATPGKLELEIAAFCEKKKLCWALWPQMDRYDVEIRFPDGDVWEIDAKAYRNPIALRTKIQNDGGFPSGDYARGYFVIPSEYTVNQRNYTAIINRVLKDQKNVECVTLKTLKTAIAKKEAACNDE